MCYANFDYLMFTEFSVTILRYWMVKGLRSKIYILRIFQCYLKTPAFPYACFPFIRTLFFILNFIKFQLTPLLLIKYNRYSKLMETD